jgi:hypothetical protein
MDVVGFRTHLIYLQSPMSDTCHSSRHGAQWAWGNPGCLHLLAIPAQVRDSWGISHSRVRAWAQAQAGPKSTSSRVWTRDSCILPTRHAYNQLLFFLPLVTNASICWKIPLGAMSGTQAHCPQCARGGLVHVVDS